MKKIVNVIFVGLCCAITIKVGPYLQDANPHSITIMWETDSNDQSIVEYGLTENLGSSQIGTTEIGNGFSRIHTVTI